METSTMKADVEYLKAPPDGGNRHSGSDFARKQMIAAGHEIERLREAIVRADMQIVGVIAGDARETLATAMGEPE